ncbi:MAG: hypothetical protein IJO57_03740 [Bacilli bacterium]|nr:hypothetical protein [Bacilli bacterium]
MGLLNNLFNKREKNNSFNIKIKFSNDDNFNIQEYERYNYERIKEFKDKYDLSTINGIRSIPVSEARKYPNGGKSVVYMPEQILNRQATDYKKNNKLDLAIECLKKANELYPYSFYAYQRNDYERLVEFLVLNKKFDEARLEHRNLNIKYGTRMDELKKLQKYAEKSGTESKNDYFERVIRPSMIEEKDREEYYWLLENIPSVAPKTFSGYRKIKKINGDSYIKIINEVKKRGNDINSIQFWD